MKSPIFFWTQEEYKPFSNFYSVKLLIDGKEWATVEHYFQAMKTLNPLEQEVVRNAPNPYKSKKLGRKVEMRADWAEVRFEVMLTALRVKFQDTKLRELLLSTEDAEIYEDSPYDKIWGTGVSGEKGTGLNLLGKALMQVRQEILESNTKR